MKYKKLLIHLVISILLTIVLVNLYGYAHEIAHFVACRNQGLDSSMVLESSFPNSIFLTNCPGMFELANWGTFLIISAPYLISLLIIFCLFKFTNSKNIFNFILPSAILINCWANIVSLFIEMDPSNDFIQAYALGMPFFQGMVLIMGLMSSIYIMMITKFLDLYQQGGEK